MKNISVLILAGGKSERMKFLKSPVNHQNEKGIDRNAVRSQGHDEVGLGQGNASAFRRDPEIMNLASHGDRSQGVRQLVPENIRPHGPAKKPFKKNVDHHAGKEKRERMRLGLQAQDSRRQMRERGQGPGEEDDPNKENFNSSHALGPA